MDFSCTVTSLRGVPVLLLTGAVDLESAPQVVERLGELVREPGGRIVVDLTGISFFDSAGLSALDQGQTAAAERGAGITVVCDDPKVLRVFEITGLIGRFGVSPTLEQAVHE